jgi:hypothetical protein
VGDEPAEDLQTADEPASAPSRRGRLRVALIAVAVLAVIGIAAALTVGGPEAPATTGDPAATLDEALAAGEPVYVLIHSLT